ncbi:MAG TPA: hypothetical protein VL096_17900 [Pirellulaceae bacterium]|nr:hypothetical protein [Pirellulaceae bacterium]
MRSMVLMLVGGGLLATTVHAQENFPTSRRPLGSQLRPSSTPASPPGTAPRPTTNLPTSSDDGYQGAASAPTFGAGTTRPRVDTASRFGDGEAPAASPPSFDRGVGEQTIPSSPQPAETTDFPTTPSTSFPRPAAGSTRTFGAGTTAPTTTRTITSGATTPSPAVSRGAPLVRAASTPAEAASPMAEMLLQQALQPRAQQELPGQPVGLTQLFERTNGAGQRIKAVQTYWKLVTKVAAYHAALDDKATFQSINVRQMPQYEKSTLAAAQMAANAAVSRAQLDFITTQNELVEAALLPDVETLPLPSDAPLVSEYRTHFDQLFGERAAPSGLRRLDRALPYHLKDVRAQADALVAAQQALQSAAEAVSSGEASVITLIEVHKLLTRERTAFLISVFDYNATIAEYALHAAPAVESREKLVGMLIKSKTLPRSAAVIHRQGQIIRETEILPVVAEETIIADSAPQLNEPARSFARETYESPQPRPRFRMQETAVQEEPAQFAPQEQMVPQEQTVPAEQMVPQEGVQPFDPINGR